MTAFLFIAAALVIAANAIGYFRLLFAKSQSGLVHCFTRFIFGLLVITSARIIFWDILPEFFTHNDWMHFVAVIGKDNVNGVFSLGMVACGGYGLASLHLMVPEKERQKWPWWKAWAYPPVDLATGLRRALRWRK